MTPNSQLNSSLLKQLMWEPVSCKVLKRGFLQKGIIENEKKRKEAKDKARKKKKR